MSKYVGGYHTLQPKQNTFGMALENVKNQMKVEGAQKVINDPNATPIQQAIALATLGHEKLGSDFYKGAVSEARHKVLAAAYGEDASVQEPPRDRSWVPDMSGRTPTIRTDEPVNQVQPGAEPQGTQTQPRFSPSGPQQASRNATALNQPQIIPQGGNAPQVAPPQPQDPFQQAAELRRIGGLLNLEQPGAGNAKLSQADALERNAHKAKEFEQKVFNSERDYNTQVSQKFREKMSGLSESIPRSEAALSMARTAIESGDLGPLSVNNLSNILGRPELLTTSGAALNFAMKQNLLGTLSEVSARAQNKWLEQMAYGAFPGIGKSDAANLTLQEAVEAELALKKAKLGIYNQLSEQDFKKQGYESADIEQRVNKAFMPISQEILDRTSYRTRVLYEEEQGDKSLRKLTNKKAPQGTPLTRRMFQVFLKKQGTPEKAIERAKQLGYKIYPNSKVEEYTQ